MKWGSPRRMRHLGAAACLQLLVIVTGCRSVESQGEGPGERRLEDLPADSWEDEKLEIVPEYDASSGLMIAHHLAGREEMMPFLLKVLESFDLYILMPRDFKGGDDRRLGVLLAAMDRRGLSRSRVHPFASREAANFSMGEMERWGRAVWARDWGPFSARTPEEGRVAYLDFQYSRLRGYQNSAPEAFYEFLTGSPDGEGDGLKYVRIPVSLAGGNLMIGGNGHGMVCAGPWVGKGKSRGAKEAAMDGKIEEVRRALGEIGGCKRVSVFESMPHEETGHIDMWAKFLSRNTVLVSTLEDSQRSDAGDGVVFDEIRNFLDRGAEQIEAMGYRVVRVPSPVPVVTGKGKLLVRTYTNSLLLVGKDGRKLAFLPGYRKPALPLKQGAADYPDARGLGGYERAAAEVFRGAGYEVMVVPADELIASGGAIHCVAMQVRVP